MKKKTYIKPTVETVMAKTEQLMIVISGSTTPEESDAKHFIWDEGDGKDKDLWDKSYSPWED